MKGGRKPMLTTLLAATITSSTSLIIRGCLVCISTYGICKNFNGMTTKANYTFKH